MQDNFFELLAKVKLIGDPKKELFLEYLMKKYLVDENFFVPMLDVAPLLEPFDLEELRELLASVE